MRKILTAILVSYAGCMALFLIQACRNKEKSDLAKGEQMARTHCATCHAFPDPSLLDKKSWQEGVLPKMAEFLNVDLLYNPFDVNGPNGDMNTTRTTPTNLFPFDDWEKISKYYIESAPDTPLKRTVILPPIETNMELFKAHYLTDQIENPLSTLVFIDSFRHELGWADGQEGKLMILDRDLKKIDSLPVPEGVVTIRRKGTVAEVLSMGVLTPSDARSGKLTEVGRHGRHVVLDSLQRPVHVLQEDLNDDGKEDLVISEFGFRYGDLCWFENTGGQHYKKHILRALPGAVRSEVHDFNGDGKPDIIALMAQGDEGVFIYYNQGGGHFREERVLRFPPVYGSNYFQLVDFNADGFQDILVTNGDNADYSISLKAYHGIRVYLNDGTNHFSEKLFLPVYGVQKAIPADFDKDGDLDLVSIAFFPDYMNQPKESFIYWENTGNGKYKRHTFDGYADGRWMTMEAGDMDGDGDLDIILGSALFGFGEVPDEYLSKWRSKGLSACVLENRVIHP